jgi:hypothetical protein
MSPCSNPYCKEGVCHGPRSPEPHACKACMARESLAAAVLYVSRLKGGVS